MNEVHECPNCGDEIVGFFQLHNFDTDRPEWRWWLSTDAWNYYPCQYCPNCGYKLPDIDVIKEI